MPRLSRLTVTFLSASYDEFLIRLEVVLVLTHLLWKKRWNILTHGLPPQTDASQCGDWDQSRRGLEPLKILIVVPYYHSLLLPRLGANGRIHTWMFAGLVVLARDTEYSFRFLFT